MPFDPKLLPPRQMFRFSVDVRRCEPLWTPRLDLDASYRLPDLSALDGRKCFADVRMAWSAEGLAWQVRVSGKSPPVWERGARLDASDGLQVWIDTRATLNVHRASRFCHRFAFLPTGGPATGGAARGESAVADQMLINRARENARPVRPRELDVRSKAAHDGYTLWAFASAAALGGFDPQQQPRLGFTYAVQDRQLGLQSFSMGAEFPYEEDPSCWAEAVLK